MERIQFILGEERVFTTSDTSFLPRISDTIFLPNGLRCRVLQVELSYKEFGSFASIYLERI